MNSGRARIRGVRVAVFDLDGTLFDSVGLWAKIDVEFLKARGHAPTKEYSDGLATLGNREAAEFTVRYYGLSDTPEALMNEWAGMAMGAYADSVKLFDGAREYIAELKAAGVRIVAATSLAPELAKTGLCANGIADMFERVFAADEMGIGKSTKMFYGRIAEELGVTPHECLVFDDVARAVTNAKEAGMRGVVVRHGERGCDGLSSISGFFQAPKVEQ